ncbi:MAG: creatininase family protein [candidate division Zixibacteria bacterium]|nr:creatininase family protein [candidate division Zixibacteria bacterium]
MERQLSRLTWRQVQNLVPSDIDTIILPVGTIEAHGVTALGTDCIIPEDLALGIADRLNALVAPTVNYGITRSLYRFNGGSTVKPESLAAYVHDILVSMADDGFRNIMVMNGHGGNNGTLKDVAMDFHQERRCNIAVIHWWDLCGDMTKEFFGHVGGHAGTDETAYVQAVDPKLVDSAAYSDTEAWYFRRGADVYPVPGTILLYKEGEGYPNFNLDQAKKYRTAVIASVGDFAETVLKRWRAFKL